MSSNIKLPWPCPWFLSLLISLFLPPPLHWKSPKKKKKEKRKWNMERDFCIFFIFFFFSLNPSYPFAFLLNQAKALLLGLSSQLAVDSQGGGRFSFEKLLSFFSKTAFEMCVWCFLTLSLFFFLFLFKFPFVVVLMCGRLHGTRFKLKACLYYCIRWPFFPFFDTSLSPSLRTNGVVLIGNCLLSPTSFLDLNQTVFFFLLPFWCLFCFLMKKNFTLLSKESDTWPNSTDIYI